jgi:hypothetical protein
MTGEEKRREEGKEKTNYAWTCPVKIASTLALTRTDSSSIRIISPLP